MDYNEVYLNYLNGQLDLFDIAIKAMKKSELLEYIEYCQGYYQSRHVTINILRNRLEKVGE